MAKASAKKTNVVPINGDDEDLIGDSKPKTNRSTGSGTAAAKQLRSFVERIERLNEEKQGIADDIRDVFAEAKGQGFDTKAMRKIIAERKQDAAERLEFESVLDLYRHALGMATEVGQSDE